MGKVQMNNNETLHGVVTTLRRKDAATAIVFEFDLRESNGSTRRIRWSTDSSGHLKEGDVATVVGQADANNILDARSLSIEPVRTAVAPIPWMLLAMPPLALLTSLLLVILTMKEVGLTYLIGAPLAAGVLILTRKKWRSRPIAQPVSVIAFTAIVVMLFRTNGILFLIWALLVIATLVAAVYAVFRLVRDRSQAQSPQR
jgi:hypothetical protein